MKTTGGQTPKIDVKPLREEIEKQISDIGERMRQKAADRLPGGEFKEPPKEESRRERLLKFWQKFCPPAMRETERARLPCSSQEIDAVLAHPIAAQSLRLVGPTDSGKTRLAWMLIESEYFTEGISIVALDFFEFAARASDAYREGTEADFFHKLFRPTIVFIDDVGKARMTQRVTEALFTIVDRRFNHRKSILFTMNYTLDSFRKKLQRDEIDPETIEALIRRIREQIPKLVVAKKD